MRTLSQIKTRIVWNKTIQHNPRWCVTFNINLQLPLPPLFRDVFEQVQHSQPKSDVQVGSQPTYQVEPEATLALIYSAAQLVQTDGSPLVFSFIIPWLHPLSLGKTPLHHHTHKLACTVFCYCGCLFNEYLHCFVFVCSYCDYLLLGVCVCGL